MRTVEYLKIEQRVEAVRRGVSEPGEQGAVGWGGKLGVAATEVRSNEHARTQTRAPAGAREGWVVDYWQP